MLPHSDTITERRFLLSISLTGIIFLAEVLGGLWTGSLALLSDSAHVFLDLLALGLSFAALRLSALPANDRHTYGYHRLEVLAALANGLTLGIVAVVIFSEAYHRLGNPQPIKSTEMLVIAVVGLIANVLVAYVLGGHHHDDHDEHDREDVNMQSAFLHVLGDAVASGGVILAAIIIGTTGWPWVDPLTSALIGLLIALSTGRVLKSALHILLEGVPEGLSVDDIGQAMAEVPGTIDIHDLHVWNLCSRHVALSAHVVLDEQHSSRSEPVMAELKSILQQRFNIEHTTIQFECVACGQGRVTCQAEDSTSMTTEIMQVT
jgi:cobalt-zinc-cadmium efflux system protein